MNIVVVSYSLTGNNKRLAEKIANVQNFKLINIQESETRKIGKIILDMFFGRKPKTNPSPQELENYDYIIFLSPVWMGKIASPMRSYLNYIKKNRKKYSFFSISGGALGTNPKIQKELKKRTGNYPDVQNDFQKVDLIKSSKKPTSQETSDYKITENDLEEIYNKIINKLKDKNIIEK